MLTLLPDDQGFDIHHHPRNSILKYAGGKGFGGKQILYHFECTKVEEVISPFFGGGSMEITLANCGVRVKGYDADPFLVNFWQQTLLHPEKVAEVAEAAYPQTDETYPLLRRKMLSGSVTCDLERAGLFYVVNRCSFSGMGFNGGGSPKQKRFTLTGIQKLARFKAPLISVDLSPFQSSIPKHTDEFMYLDPPYDIKNPGLYGVGGNLHKNFDHKGLSELVLPRSNWIMSYNDCPLVRNLYGSLDIQPVKWTYHMKAGQDANRKSSEVLIFSKDLGRKVDY